MREITDRARAFAEAYVNGPDTTGNAAASAVASGFSERAARQEGYRLLRHEGVRREIDRLVHDALADHAAAAVQLLGVVIRDERAPLKIRVEACKTVLDRAGHIAPRAGEPPKIGEKTIASMSIAELESYIQEGRERIAREALAIDVTPVMIEANPAAS